MAFDILNASKNISDKYVRYLKTMFDIQDSEYKTLFLQKMKEIGSFSRGPYLDVVDSFQSGSSVESLISEGILHPDFCRMPDIYGKILYKHQEIAVRKLNQGHNIVVSTGTGSGKTESFLIPIINSLLNEKQRRNRLTPGVRALLIYPMNALANDQINRLRGLLADYPEITYGAYTGQTEEKEARAVEKYKYLNNGNKPAKNELISREKMKETPPHILITNYSMLEYLMLRPQDNCFFQGPYSHNWRFIVLDEAHTYSGSTGIEVSMLLRRLKAHLMDSDIRFILTSATLGGEDSDREVAEFAKNLCDAPFDSQDVIRAFRIKLSQNMKDAITLSSADYREMNDIIDSGMSESRQLSMLENYLGIPHNSEDLNEYLYDTLLRDSTFWKLKNLLTVPKAVSEICSYMNWQEKDLSAFVNVASNAIRNRKKLFDSRYHMFIRATDGAFVTLGKKKLSLVRKENEWIDNKEYRYFEIVTCSQCHAIYLLGAVSDDGSNTLQQKANLDIGAIREAFLIGDQVNDDDDDSNLEDENLKVNHYELCPHCGFIRPRDQVHKADCGHPENEYIPLIKVKVSERSGRVTKCIQCEGTNNMGILRSFFTGQEASTSVIGTALFEELPEKEAVGFENDIDDNGFDDGFDDGFDLPPVENFKSKAKQYIAFSDNRQAAAFFATYFYETYQGFLYSRIVNENLKWLDERGKPLVNFARDMSADFKEHKISEMFDVHPDYLKEAWKAIMRELIESYSRNSLIGLGLMKIDFCDEIRMSGNRNYNFTTDDVRNICLVLLRSFFEDNAIYHGQTFTEADIAFYSNNSAEGSYVLSNPTNKYLKSFVPKTNSTTNKRFDYLQRIFIKKGLEPDRDMITSFMGSIWKILFERQNVFHDNVDHSGKKVDISKFKVVKTDKWFRCPKCQRLTPYNVEGVCPAYRCDGDLEPVNVESIEKNNHYYRIYNDLNMQPLRVVEHTAQLNSEEAYRLQDKFKRQEIDVLSCSTTFEMGVDIGDLETVFMRNMPPTPSNYVQRAGRAGRSLKSAALALTFCNKSNHDFSYYENPVSMIKGEIQPPLFKVENEKIGIRHLYASALSFFWKRNPEYFRTISAFFGNEQESDGYETFREYLESKPGDLKEYLLRTFPEVLINTFEIRTFGWIRWLFNEPDNAYPNLKTVFEQYRDDIKQLYAEKKSLEDQNRPNGAVIHRINTYVRENSISFLSRHNILPKYGFPVDTVELKVASDKKGESLGIDLSRDLSMAISEYAPGCEVVAAGNLIRSRYIKRVPSKSWRLYDYVTCKECNTLNLAIHREIEEDRDLSKCRQCGQEFLKTDIETFLIPEFGFDSESKIEKPTLIRPDKTYRTEASTVSQGNTITQSSFNAGDIQVKTVNWEDGEVAILNKSHFYVCPVCGFSLGSFETNAFTDTLKMDHHNAKGYSCKGTVLRKYSLGYRFKTDSLSISIDEMMNYQEAYSVLQAIIISACNTLNIDHGEIEGCLQYAMGSRGPTYDFIIYDTTPGGAGHVRRFSDETIMKRVLKGAYDKAKNCDCGGKEGNTSCYKCLRTFRNQYHHDEIKRRYVIDQLGKMF